MIANATFGMDRGYFELFYSEWLSHRSRYRRFILPIAVLFLLLAAIAFFALSAKALLPWVLLVVGVGELLDGLTHQIRWMRLRLKGAGTNQATIRFTEWGIECNTDKSHGSISYDGFHEFDITPNGLFLIPQKGISIFVPLAAIIPQEAISDIRQRLSVRSTERK